MTATEPPSSEADFFYRLAAERLRDRCRWGGAILIASLLLPYEVIDGQPQFVWSLFGELSTAAIVATIAPALAGLVLVALGLRAKSTEGLLAERATSVAVGALAALAAFGLVIKIGSEAADWDLLPLPESFVQRPVPPLAALALTAAGASLAFRARARRIGHVLLIAAVVPAIGFYAWPARGEAPGRTLLRALSLIGELPGIRAKVGLLVVAVLALWPAIVALAGLVHVRRPPRRDHPMLSIVAVFGLPALLLMVVYQLVLQAGFGPAILAAVGAVLVLVATVAIAAAALEVLGDALATPRRSADFEGGLRLRVAAPLAAGCVVAVTTTQIVLARPPSKGVTWTLAARSPDADRLFGELVPAWDRSREYWDQRVRKESGATTLVEAKARAREMTTAARDLPNAAGVAEALETLTHESNDLDLAGRRWVRLVRDLNEANRSAQLPYYLDPNVRILETPSGLVRQFVVHPYAVEAVHTWHVDGRPFATLIVHGLGATAGSHFRLGFSRDMDPFALVVADEVDSYREDLDKSAERGRCASAPAGADDADAAMRRCGEVLSRLHAELGPDLRAAVLAATERHELQHQIDGPHLPLSAAVAELLAGYAKESQDRANRELSAYVAELTASGAPAVLALVHLFPFGVLHRAGAEHRVAVLVLEALSGQRLRRTHSEVDILRITEALVSLAALSNDELVARAGRAYRTFFGQALPRITPG